MSFTRLLKVHEHLNELFLLHQESLLRFEIDLATRRLRSYERELRAHIRAEEDVLMPVFERAGKIAGAPPEFFIGEHTRMLAFLSRFAEMLSELRDGDYEQTRKLIDLLDEEARFKGLCDHHDMRERNLFFPALDRVTDDTERQELINQCLAAHSIETESELVC